MKMVISSLGGVTECTLVLWPKNGITVAAPNHK